jgi:serine/threonine protein kinase
LKVLPGPGQLDSKRLQRFAREAKAAARLHHTNIVPVYGVGEGVGEQAGLRYFVMQFIAGQSLDHVFEALQKQRQDSQRDDRTSPAGNQSTLKLDAEAVDPVSAPPVSQDSQISEPSPAPSLGSGLSGTGRLYYRSVAGIGMQVARALDYAARQGVLHRDVKPANLLLDGAGQIWITDFGLAKLTDGDDLTHSGELVGTLRYMAPERFAGRFDARADVYSLGLTLYELLTLQPAFPDTDRSRLMARILNEEPPRPRSLNPAIPRDLETIVLKAIAREPQGRYATAGALADDLERFLADQPIDARRSSVLERAWRWSRRNPAWAALVASVSLLGLAIVIISSLSALWLADRAEQERLAKVEAQTARQKEAERADGEKHAKLQAQAAVDAEKKANALARKRLEQIQKGSNILASVFTDLDPRAEEKEGKPLRLILGGRLVKAAEQLEGESVGDPLLVADLQMRLGRSLLSLGMADRAIPLIIKARATRATELGADHPDTLRSMNVLATGYQAAGKLKLALAIFEETLQLRQAHLDANHPDTLDSMNDLAVCYQAAGKLDLALPLYEKTLKLRQAKRGADDPDTLTSMNNLASGYHAARKLDLALPLFVETLQLRKIKLGADHPDTLISMNNLAGGYQAAGKLDKALPLYQETLDLARDKLGADHPKTLTSLNNLAFAYRADGKPAKALPLFQEAATGIEKRRFQHEHAGKIVGNLIDCLEQLRRFDQAEPWRRKWLPELKERAGAESPLYTHELAALGNNLLLQKKWIDAEPVLRDCLTVREKKTPDEWTTFHAKSMLGAALLGQKKYADAEPLLLAGYEGMKQRELTSPQQSTIRLIEAARRLILLYDALGNPAEAVKWGRVLAQTKDPTKQPDKR